MQRNPDSTLLDRALAFWLHLQGLSHAEIARQLGCSPRTPLKWAAKDSWEGRRQALTERMPVSLNGYMLNLLRAFYQHDPLTRIQVMNHPNPPARWNWNPKERSRALAHDETFWHYLLFKNHPHLV